MEMSAGEPLISTGPFAVTKCSARLVSKESRVSKPPSRYILGADKSLGRPGRKKARKHVKGARDFNNIETRAAIKFLVLQGKAPKDIHAILTQTLACFLPGRAKDLSAPLYYTCYSITPHSPVVFSLQYSTQNTPGLQTPSVPNIMGRLNNVQEGPKGGALGGQLAATSPWKLQSRLH